MVSECRQAITLVKASGDHAKYLCTHCGASQYAIMGRDGIERWSLGSRHDFNSWVHGECQRGCGNEGQEPSTCPFNEEVNPYDKTLCNCCPDCAHECAMDI